MGDALKELKKIADKSVKVCVTSPPYWGLRDYGVAGQLGLEKSPEEYVGKMVEIFREVRRVLKDDGTLWLNLGDSYANSGRGGIGNKSTLQGGHQNQNESRAQKVRRSKIVGELKPKDLIGIPWRVAFALQDDGWFLRQDIIWHKTNPMPESVRDRCTKAHEYVFLLSKRQKYYFDIEAIKEPATYGMPSSPDKIKSICGQGFTRRAGGGGKKLSSNACFGNRKDSQNLDKAGEKIYETRQKRSVWSVATTPFKGAHFATFPPKLIEPCVLAGCPIGGTVLDPFAGAGTTWLVAKKLNRNFIGIELNPDYAKMAIERVNNETSPDLQRAFVE